MRTTAKSEIAAQRLPPVQAIAIDAADPHQRGGFGHDHLRAGRGEREVHAKRGKQHPRLRARRHDQRVAGDPPARRIDRDDLAPVGLDRQSRAMLQDAPAQILQRPGIGLHGALRIGMAAKAQMNAAKAALVGQRHHVLRLLAVQIIDAVAHRAAHPPDRAVMVEQVRITLDDDAFALIFGRVAEQIVHLRP
ncbi:hypothetical protein D9M73_160180 [compost metagenome]